MKKLDELEKKYQELGAEKDTEEWPIHGCDVLDTKPPTLYDMRNKELSCAELQLALVHLIDLYNKQGKEVAAAITELRRYRDSRRDFDIMNTPYGI